MPMVPSKQLPSLVLPPCMKRRKVQLKKQTSVKVKCMNGAPSTPVLKLLLLTCPCGPHAPSAAMGTGFGPTPCSAGICGKTYQRSLGFTLSVPTCPPAWGNCLKNS